MRRNFYTDSEPRNKKKNTFQKLIMNEKVYVLSKPGISVIYSLTNERTIPLIVKNLVQKITRNVLVRQSKNSNEFKLIRLIERVILNKKRRKAKLSEDEHLIDEIVNEVWRAAGEKADPELIKNLITDCDIFFIDVYYSSSDDIALGRYRKLNRLSFSDQKFKYFVLSVYNDRDIDKIVKKYYETEINGSIDTSVSYKMFLRDVITLYESGIIVDVKNEKHINSVYEFLKAVLNKFSDKRIQ
jgi:hypothetical protein